MWQFLTAPVTVFLLSRYLTKPLQGYYYVFFSWLAMQVFFELGLSAIVLLIASHEWAALRLEPDGTISGEPAALSRLASLERKAGRWFAVSSLLFLVAVGGAGILLIGAQPTDIRWFGPWLGTVVVNALAINCLPRLSILEGCNQMAPVNRVRLFQAISGTAVVWASLVLGAELWTVMVSNACRYGWEAYLVYGRYRAFFATLARTPPGGEEIGWRRDVWPLQWRAAAQSAAGFFVSKDFFISLAFPTQGAVAAGRTGMTWSILASIQSLSLAWIQSRMSEFGMLASRGDRPALDRQYLKSARVAFAAFMGAGLAFWLALCGLPIIGLDGVQQRFLPLGTTALLIAALCGLQAAIIEQSYVRLFKVDPFLFLNLAGSGIVAGLFLIFGRSHGAIGAITAYGIYTWCVTLPATTLILWQQRRS